MQARPFVTVGEKRRRNLGADGSTWARSTIPCGTTSPEQVAVYAVQLNAADVGQWVLLRRESDWYASEEALHAWRIAVDPSLTPLLRHGQRWFALRHLPGYRAREDPMRQDLAIWLTPTVFDDTRLPAEAQPNPALQPVEPALHLNLEVNYMLGARTHGSQASRWASA